MNFHLALKTTSNVSIKLQDVVLPKRRIADLLLPSLLALSPPSTATSILSEIVEILFDEAVATLKVIILGYNL